MIIIIIHITCKYTPTNTYRDGEPIMLDVNIHMFILYLYFYIFIQYGIEAKQFCVGDMI